MKKTYLARRNALLSTRSVSWGAGALIFSLLMLGIRLVAPNTFWQIMAPVFKASDAVADASHSFFSQFGDAAKLARTNEELVAHNLVLTVENQMQKKKIADQETLLGSPSRSARPGIVAGVVSRPPTSPYDTLVLAAGSDNGVTIGMEAFGSAGVPVGIISSLTNDFSRVTLFSAPGVMTDGWVGENNLPLTLIGAGAGALHAAVARDAGVSIGDVVFVPGPGQLPLGSVVRVDSDPLSPAVTLRIVSIVNPFSISLVELRHTGIRAVTLATSTLP